MQVMAARRWKGYDGVTPLLHQPDPPKHVARTRDDYRTLLFRVGWQMERRDGRVVPWNPRVDCLRPPDRDAWGAVTSCGRGAAHVYKCSNGCRIAFPFGCADRWCLRCEGFRASQRANKIQERFQRVIQDTNLKVGRVVFTVHPDHHPIAGSKRGSKAIQSRAFDILCTVLGYPNERIAAFTTFHPTSSEHPWRPFPHVELIWIHAAMDSRGILPLNSTKSGLLSPEKLEILKGKWAEIYPLTTNIQVSYIEELSHHFLRYLVRPMCEDVWFAIDNGFLSLDDSKDVLGLAPVTVPSEAEVGLRKEGGVIFWPGYHRVRYFGAMANNRFGPLMDRLGKGPVVHPVGLKECPCCDGALTLERDENGPVCITLSPYQEPEVDNIMFTLGKSNGRTEDC